MLKAFRSGRLHKSQDSVGGYFACVEAYQISDPNGQLQHHLACDRLEESQVEDWVSRRGAFRASSLPGALKTAGGLRLLFAQSKTKAGKAAPSKITSSSIREALYLPDGTFACFRQPAGVYSSHTYPEAGTNDSFTRLALVLRAPQKWECSVGGITISHDFESGVTTALNVGYTFLLDEYRNSQEPPEPLSAFLELLKYCQEYWSHPLLLPCLFLITHVKRVENYLSNVIKRDVVQIEQSIGVTKAGRSEKGYIPFFNHSQPSTNLFLDGEMQRQNAKQLIARINDLSTWIVFAQRSPQWDIDCVDHLLDILNHNTKLRPSHDPAQRHFRETPAYLRNYSEACRDEIRSAEARMKLQLNILYTLIAQDDGQTSARIAAAAGKDSTSMRIIALITAAYLPATFVATLFSGMFSWQGTGNAGGSSVSSDFWLYWAVAVPLTIATLVGWAIWWRFEEYRFDRDVRRAEHKEDQHIVFDQVKMPFRRRRSSRRGSDVM